MIRLSSQTQTQIMMNYIKYYMLSIGLIASFSLFGQESLSLDAAIKKGLENNYDITIESSRIDVATNNNDWGEAGRMPTVTFNTDINNNRSDIDNDPQFNFGFVSPGFMLNNSKSNAITPSVNVGWTFFSGNKVNIGKQRLANMQKESEGNADIVVANTIQAIILGYYRSVLESRRLEELNKQLKLSSDKLYYMQIKSDVGGAVISEVLLEESNYLNDSVNYINQQLIQRSALRQLNLLLAEPNPNKEYILTDGLIINWESMDYNSLLSSIEQNEDLKKLYISQSILGNNVQMNKSDLYPTLGLNTGYQYNINRQNLTNAVSNISDENGIPLPTPENATLARTGAAYINFRLTFNLYNGGKVNRAIKNAIINEDIGNIKIEKMKASITNDLAEAYDAYTVRMQIYEIDRRKTVVSQQSLDISKEKFQNGSINSFDFRIVQNNSLMAAIQELQSLYNLLDARVTLMRLTGGILEEFIE